MNSFTEIRIPREIVNDDVVLIAAWEAEHGAKVAPKQVVASIETSKAIVDVEAEVEGYLEILHPTGAEVPVGALIGRIQSQPLSARTDGAPAALASSGTPASRGNGTPPAAAAGAPGLRISRKAQGLIEQYAIDASAFGGIELVRESDVLAYLERQKAGTAAATAMIEVPAAREESEPAPAEAPDAAKPQHLAAGSTLWRSATFCAMPECRPLNEEAAAWLAWRSIICGGTGFWETSCAGRPVGIILPLHRLRGVKIGKDCYIDPNAIIETAYPENITIGDDVRVTARAIIMTHIKAPHHLRETGIMPMVLKPVRLEDHRFIGVNSVIMPGVTVGKAAVVASGAVVITSVPPYTMVAGNPAKVVKTFRKPPEEA